MLIKKIVYPNKQMILLSVLLSHTNTHTHAIIAKQALLEHVWETAYHINRLSFIAMREREERSGTCWIGFSPIVTEFKRLLKVVGWEWERKKLIFNPIEGQGWISHTLFCSLPMAVLSKVYTWSNCCFSSPSLSLSPFLSHSPSTSLPLFLNLSLSPSLSMCVCVFVCLCVWKFTS